ncbi:hypothetical protein ACSSS7_004291 [Eimeria intestinalis]
MRTSGAGAAAAAAAAAGSKRSRPGLLLRKPLVMGTYAFRLSQAGASFLRSLSSVSLCASMPLIDGLLSNSLRLLCFPSLLRCGAVCGEASLAAAGGEDISYFIKKVVFELDPSFVNPRRSEALSLLQRQLFAASSFALSHDRVVSLTAPPYEVSEAGWGEFCLIARIFLVDESLPPVEMSHFLRLNLPGASQSPCVASEYANSSSSGSSVRLPFLCCRCVLTYDELLVYEPSDWFYDKVTSAPFIEAPPHPLSPYFLQTANVEENQLQLCLGLQGYVQARALLLLCLLLLLLPSRLLLLRLLLPQGEMLSSFDLAPQTESIALMQEAFLLTLRIQELQRQHEAITTGAAPAAAAAAAAGACAAPAALTAVQGEGVEGAAAMAPSPGFAGGCIDPSASAPPRQAAQNVAFHMGSPPGPSTQVASTAGGHSLGGPGAYESPKSPQFSVGADPHQQQQQQQRPKGMMLPQAQPPSGILT